MNRSIWSDVLGLLLFTSALAISAMAWAMALTR